MSDSEDDFRPIGILNPIKANYIESDFFYEYDDLILKMDTSRHMRKELAQYIVSFEKINKQTDVAFRHLNFRYGKDSKPFNTKIIKTYPYSLDLLSHLEFNRKVFTPEELEYYLSLFDGDLAESKSYKDLRLYLDTPVSEADVFPKDLRMETASGSYSKVTLSSTKLNLVVFWASWCGPCRQEIPDLKELQKFSGDKVSITSISIDQNKESWMRALRKEGMPWAQYVTDDKNKVVLDKRYDLSRIPVWILLDSNNRLIYRKLGHDTGEKGVVPLVTSFFKK